jgi:hypothetical protein
VHAPNDTTTLAQSVITRLIQQWEYRHLRAWAGVRFAAGISSWLALGPDALLRLLGVVSAAPGGGAALLVRLSGDDCRPIRTSPNLSLRYSHWPDRR